MKTLLIFPLPVAILAALLCAPTLGSAQTILQSADDFTLLGGTFISSTGTVGTVISNGSASGNLGLWPTAETAITGFPPAEGTIIPTGGVTQQAMADLMTAAAGLSGMPSNVNMSNVDMGGTTLLPGVYTFDGAATLNGALFLDANGQNNAFWVFQIGTTLTTSIGSAVTLINPGSNLGSDDGIFWDAQTGITIGANSDMLGNYLAGTNITFSGTTSGSGGVRALAQAGISLDDNMVNSQAPGGGDWTGGLRFGPNDSVIPAIPEPAMFLWLVPLSVLGLAIGRRRFAADKIAA